MPLIQAVLWTRTFHRVVSASTSRPSFVMAFHQSPLGSAGYVGFEWRPKPPAHTHTRNWYPRCYIGWLSPGQVTKPAASCNGAHFRHDVYLGLEAAAAAWALPQAIRAAAPAAVRGKRGCGGAGGAGGGGGGGVGTRMPAFRWPALIRAAALSAVVLCRCVRTGIADTARDGVPAPLSTDSTSSSQRLLCFGAGSSARVGIDSTCGRTYRLPEETGAPTHRELRSLPSSQPTRCLFR